MANTLKNELARNIGTSATTLYTCPASTKTIIIGMTCSNVHTNTQINTDIYLTSGGNDYHIIKNGTIAVGGTLVPIGGEQKVILETDASKARELARPVAKIYQKLPNYRNNWLRMGMTEQDIDDLSDRFIDATFAWGSADAIKARVQEHIDAGADHVCVQPVNPNGQFGDLHWDCLEAITG